jgi:hypothetical protein
MHPTPLPRAAEQDRVDGLLEAGVGVRDDQLHPTEPARLERAEERSPERAVLAVADGEPEPSRQPSARTPEAITTAWDTTRRLTRALQ